MTPLCVLSVHIVHARYLGGGGPAGLDFLGSAAVEKGSGERYALTDPGRADLVAPREYPHEVKLYAPSAGATIRIE